MKKQDESTLSLSFSKKEHDFLVKYPVKCDGKMVLHHLLSNIALHNFQGKEYEMFSFIKELEKRGYDPKTLRFSIKLKEVEE